MGGSQSADRQAERGRRTDEPYKRLRETLKTTYFGGGLHRAMVG